MEVYTCTANIKENRFNDVSGLAACHLLFIYLISTVIYECLLKKEVTADITAIISETNNYKTFIWLRSVVVDREKSYPNVKFTLTNNQEALGVKLGP